MTDQETNKSTDGKNAHTENFPVASLLIRADLRPHMMACYAFARAADNIGDDPLMPADEKIARLDAMEKALLDPADASVPSAPALRASLAQLGIPTTHAQDLLTAFRQDVIKSRYDNWDELMEYCRYSASPVGRQVLAIHGLGQDLWPSSDALCSVLQIVNHLQDCADDYRELDRVYIPLDLFAQNGSKPEDLTAASCTPGLRKTLDACLDRLDPMMKLGAECHAKIPDFRLKMEIAVIYTLCEKMITRLRTTDPLAENAKLSKPQKIAALMLGVARALFHG